MAKPYKLLRAQMSKEAQQKAAAKARAILESPPAPAHPADRGEATKCTDATSARATGYADATAPAR